MGRGWYRRRHVDRDFCGHPGANPGGRFTLHILRALQPQRNNAPVGATHEGVFDLP